MVDSIVGQANMIRSILGLPERELVEDTSQEEGMSLVWLYCKRQVDIMVVLWRLAQKLGFNFLALRTYVLFSWKCFVSI